MSRILSKLNDGVIAIITTIMVLELRVPTGSTFLALRPCPRSFMWPTCGPPWLILLGEISRPVTQIQFVFDQ
jgi:hypothetical protein